MAGVMVIFLFPFFFFLDFCTKLRLSKLKLQFVAERSALGICRPLENSKCEAFIVGQG